MESNPGRTPAPVILKSSFLFKDVNPASGQAGINYMQDPNLQAAGTQDQEAIKQQAEQAEVAQESASQDQAATQDSEEGTTEG